MTGRSYTYSDGDHLLTAGSVDYQYDVDGFLYSKTDGTDQTTYTYSSRGELLQVDLPGGDVISYVCDPMGRRIAKKVNGTITEKYLWQGMTRLLAVHDGSDNLKQRFEYADGRMPVAMEQSGNTYFLAYDQVGSLRAVSDGSGNVIKTVEYDTFGNVLSDSNTSFKVPFGFAGGLFDTHTGLIRFGYRDYDPEIGRWTAKDPIGFAGGDTDLFGYCLDDPVNWVDVRGLKGLVSMLVDEVTDTITSGGIGGITGKRCAEILICRYNKKMISRAGDDTTYACIDAFKELGYPMIIPDRTNPEGPFLDCTDVCHDWFKILKDVEGLCCEE